MKVQSNHDGVEKEHTILQKMALGHPFKEDRGIFKNIHSLLKSKKKHDIDHLQKRDKGGEIEEQHGNDLFTRFSKSTGTSTSIPPEDRAYSLGQDSLEGTSPTPLHSSVGYSNFSSIDSSECHSRSEGVQDMQIKPSTRNMSRWTSNENQIDSSQKQDQKADEDGILNTILHVQTTRPQPQRKSSYHSIGSNNASRAFRSSNLISGKRDGKSLRGSRTSLKRMNSGESSHRGLITSSAQHETQDLLPAPRKTYQPMISHAGIPFHHSDNSSNDQFPRITAETLKRIVEDEIYKSHFESYYVIDCRFEYEFKGGHINNALNISSREDLESEFIQKERKLPTLLIFHCEFSSYRGPMLASHLRNCDRMLNYENYPDLFYPDILILDGGYKGFFDCYPNLCFPRKYVGMDSSENLLCRDQQLERFRQDSKRMISRNSSLHKLTSVSSSTRSSVNKGYQDQNSSSFKLNCTASPSFKYEAPPKLSLSRYSNDSLFGNSDDSSSGSRLSINSSPNLSTNKMLMMDGVDGESFYSFEEGDSTFTTPVATLSTPTNKPDGYGPGLENSSLNPVKRLLFPNILKEEDGEASD